jgi:hypothetical protein
MQHQTFSKRQSLDFSHSREQYVPGSVDKKGGRRCRLLLYKDGTFFPPFFV